MPTDRIIEACQLALELAKSGQYERASSVDDILRSMGYSAEVDGWLGKWEQDRLNLLCRDSADANDGQGGS